MKRLKTFESYLDSEISVDLYDKMSDLLNKAQEICGCELSDPDEAMEKLDEIGTDDALDLFSKIYDLNIEIDESEIENSFDDIDNDDDINED